MNLKSLTDSQLLTSLNRLVNDEREILSKILLHFQEVERRRLYCTFKCSSLFDYAVRIQKYSADAAQRRIAAMRLLKEVPGIEDKIDSGALTLTHLGMARAHIKQAHKEGKPLNQEEKSDLLNQISGISTREAQKVLATVAPKPPQPDSIRYVSEDRVEIKFEADAKIQEKLARVKGKLAHKFPGAILEDVLNHLLDKEIDAERPAAPRMNSQAQVIREIHAETKHRCANCGTYHAPQTDHRTPRACGGSSEKENLRQLCRKCNQRAAIEKLGMNKMDPYINRTPLH